MNVGFYYHVPSVFEAPATTRVPSMLGMFVRELARHAGRVTFYTHGGPDTGVEDDPLGPPDVHCVDLGPRASFPRRLLLPRSSLAAFSPRRDGVDVMLVRGPSALLPHLVRACDVPVVLHIVGDYADQRPDPATDAMPAWRRRAVRAAQRVYTVLEHRAARRAAVIVNTPDLAARFGLGPEDVIFESTLREADVADAPAATGSGLGRDRAARLLFTGRLAPEKGLWEAVDAVRLLAERGVDAVLEIVGPEEPGGTVRTRLTDHASAIGVGERIRFRGYVPAGEALAAVYRSADVFVLPTYGEGFPRSLFEAMGAGLPAVTTPVGGIVHWLRDGENAILVAPRSAEALAGGIARVLDDDLLRGRIAERGLSFARAHTLERCCALLARRLAEHAGAP